MKTLKAIRNIFGVCGFVMLYLAISTSDYYVIELNTTEPRIVTVLMAIGSAMFIPAAISLAIEGLCKQ